MKIIIISNLFYPNLRGGAEQAAYNQAKKLASLGNEVFVISLSGDGVERKENFENIFCYYLRSKNIFSYLTIGEHNFLSRLIWHIVDMFNFAIASDIKNILKKEKPDLAILHNIKGLSFLLPKLLNKMKIKTYIVMHDIALYTPSGIIMYGEEKNRKHTGIIARFYRFLTRRLFAYPEKVFFPSAWLLTFYRMNNFFVHQEKLYQPNELDFICEKNYGKKDGFLYVGQIERQKGILLLLDIFNYAQYPMLYIVGEGSLLGALKEKYKNNPVIKFYGRVDREKLKELYASAKTLIVPSLLYENAPMVISEALSCGMKILGSNLGGIPEMIKDGEGEIFEPGNAKDLSEKMKMFL